MRQEKLFPKVLSGVRAGVVLASLVAFVASAAPAWAVEYGGVGGRPANPRSDNPRTESIFIHTISPGEEVLDAVKVLNNTAEQKTLLVYAVDSAVSSGGAFACAQQVDAKDSVGSWITLSKSEVVLPSLAYEIVPFTLKAPSTASVGEHNGCIIIQEKKEVPAEQQSGIQLSFRTGLRVAALVPGAIVRDLAIAGFSVESKQGGDFILKPSLQNKGNVSVDADVQVETVSFYGTKIASHGGEYPILRGEESDWNFELKKPFWGGFYKSSLSVRYGDNPSALVGQDVSGNDKVLVGPSVWFWSTPTIGALAIEISILLILLGLLLLVIRRYRMKRQIQHEWVEYMVKTGETINSIAERYGISWKLLAKANALQAPYVLVAKQKIKVPPPRPAG